jgi:hypothetical protein
LKKIIFIVCFSLLNFAVIDQSFAQEWKRYQEFTPALGNQFASPMRESGSGKASDSYTVMPCTSEPIDPYVVVTAAHCIWGIYGDQNNAYSHNGGTIWIQEPGKRADDPTAKRVKVVEVIRPDSLGNSVEFPTAKTESQDDIAFLVLEKPIVEKVAYKIASLEQIKYAIDNGIKMRVYGYGLNSIAESNAYYSMQENQRYNVSDQLNPRMLEYSFYKESLPSGYKHFIGLPKMVIAKLPVCGATGTSGSPAVIEINGEEFLIGPGSHSTGWDCPELKDYSAFTAANDPNYKYRNTFSHIIIANYPDLLKKALSMVPQQNKAAAVEPVTPTVSATPTPSATPTQLAEVAKVVKKKITIKCYKGKRFIYITNYSPVCPSGYVKL